MRFTGKRIFVTGAAAGIGEATVKLFRQEGAQVVGVDVVEAEGVGYCDVSNPESVTAAMDAAIDELGLCNRHLAVNLTGPMLVTQAALPYLRASTGNIVTVGSISGLQGQPYNSSYCASKAGLIMFMKALAVELAADGIRVNLVCPGGVDTAMSTNALSNIKGDIDFSHFPKMMGVLPGMMAPVKIAEALAHLASDAASTTTGASLVVDNGTLW